MTNIRSIELAIVSEVASVYAEVFAGPPWNEVSRCSDCGVFSSALSVQSEACPCGGCFESEAYPQKETTLYIQKELEKQLALGLWLAYATAKGFEARGFGWGYQSSAQSLGEEKYQTEEMRTVITDLLVNTGAFFYISEVGVLPSLQGQGWGKKLTDQLIRSNAGFSSVVLRTNEDSPMRYISENLGMTPIVGLKTGMKDIENEKRVVFVGRR